MNVIGIQGSPSLASRSASLLNCAQSRLQSVASRQQLIAVRELPAEALLHAQFDHPLIQQALQAVAQADVVLIATPIYKAAYSGLLKSFLDLIPQDGLRGKTLLPLATGGSLAHLLAIDYALKPVLSALGGRDILDSVYAIDSQLVPHPKLGHVPSEELISRIDSSMRALLDRDAVVRTKPVGADADLGNTSVQRYARIDPAGVEMGRTSLYTAAPSQQRSREGLKNLASSGSSHGC